MNIGFFDSGLGGLTILKSVRDSLPEYAYAYLGDTANVPYGDKTEKEICILARAGIERLLKSGSQLVIVACNTVSAESLRMLQDTVFNIEYPDRKVLGVIIPTIETLSELHTKKALLIGTSRTISSGKYEYELRKYCSQILLKGIATPSLVSKIEMNDTEGAFIEFQKYVKREIEAVDTLILGCTHYTVLKEMIRAMYPDIHVLSQDEIIPTKIKKYLSNHPEIESKLDKSKNISIELTRETEHYTQLKKNLFGLDS